jgi:hypothetical protein
MKIKCCFNKLSDLKNEKVRDWVKSNWTSPDENEPIDILVIGKEYCVYGIVFWDNVPMYYICEEEKDDYPVPTYSGFYKVIDSRLSKYWQLGVDVLDDGRHCSEIVFKEWKEEEMFYEKLLDGEEREESVFKKYKKLMDREFEISNTGPIGTKIWLFIDDEMAVSDFENWIYKNKDLEKLMPEDLYMQLISFNYREVDGYELSKLKDKLKLWIKGCGT